MRNTTGKNRAELVGFVARAFLVIGWARAALEKSISDDWWTGAAIRTYATKQEDLSLVFFRPILHLLKSMALPVGITVTVLEWAIAIAIAWRPLRLGLRVATVLTVLFILAGSVNPAVFYLLFQLSIMLGLTDTIRYWKISATKDRSLWYAGMWFIIALFLTPFIRTLYPADLIADPAAVLAMLSTLVGTRWLLYWKLTFGDVTLLRWKIRMFDKRQVESIQRRMKLYNLVTEIYDFETEPLPWCPPKEADRVE